MQLTPGFWNVIDAFSNFGTVDVGDDVSLSTVQVFDEEKYLPPIDVATNLFYYKGTASTSPSPADIEIKDDDEIVIINARKMNNELNQIDLEPGDANLALDLDSFKNKELTLTAQIECNSKNWQTFIKPIKLYSNHSNYTYSKTVEANAIECRYIDGRGYGNQYDLYELNSNIQFNSIDLENIPFLTYKDNGNTVGDIIEAPCKLSLKLSGLIVQQQCRIVKEWDKIDNITFDQRIFLSSFFGNDMIKTTRTDWTDTDLSTNDELMATKWYQFQPRMIGNGVNDQIYGTKQISGLNLSVYGSNGEELGISEYYIIGKSLNTLVNSNVSLGGKYYYNDFQSMKMVQNSVKTWKTYLQDNKFEGFTIYGDYSPNEKIIGEPYLNISENVYLYEYYTAGTNFIENDYVGAVVKIAEDNKNINNVINISEIASDEPRLKLKTYSFDTVDNSQKVEDNLNGIVSSFQMNFYGEIDYDYIEKGGVVDLVIDPTNFNPSQLHNMNYKNYSGGALSVKGNMMIKGTYLILNGLPGTEQSIVWEDDENSEYHNIINNQNTVTRIIGIKSSNVILYNTGVISGIIEYYVSDKAKSINALEQIEIHHVNLPAPILTNIGISFTDYQKENLDRNGYFPINDNIWRREVAFNSTACTSVNLLNKVSNINKLRIYSSLIPEQTIKGKITPLFDDENELSGFFIELKLNKISTFKKSELKMYLENKKEIQINDQDTLSAYHRNIGGFYNGMDNPSIFTPSAPDEYNSNVIIGDTVISGDVQAAYNYVQTDGIKLDSSNKNISVNGAIAGVGYVKHVFNPIDDNLFQLEVITKNAGEEFNKTLYYVNKPVNKWYNLAIYRYNKTNEAGTEQTSKLGFILSDVDEENIEDITSKSEEIFNCQVTNDTILDGKEVKFDLLNNDFSRRWNEILFNERTNLYKYNTLYDIGFEKCGRAHWNCKYSDDPKNLANSYQITETEYKKRSRKNVDLFNIGNSSFANIKTSFKNRSGLIKLFANKELEYELSRGLYNTLSGSQPAAIEEIERPAYYNLYVDNFSSGISGFTRIINTSGKRNEYYNNDLGNKLNINEYTLLNFSDNHALVEGSGSIFNLLFNNYVSNISFNDNYDNYIVKYKTDREFYPKLRSSEIEAKNVMIVMSPNLTQFNEDDDQSDLGIDGSQTYNESYRESLKAVNDYIEYFGNPQHRMPPVTYSNLLLSSEYATFIYNNCETYNAIEFSDSYVNTNIISNDYINNPNTVAYIWGNSKVSRAENSTNGTLVDSKLIWNQLNYNEAICEIGSIYNYYDSKTTENTTTLEVGSIIERQCVMMPVLSSPFSYEKRSKETGLIKVNDTIIATAALGYNSNGLPINSILKYNNDTGIEIDSTNKQYIYLGQNTDSSCYINTTVQKPVFIDSVTKNNQSLPECYEFLPNPTITIKSSEGYDSGLEIIMGGDLEKNISTNETISKFIYGTSAFLNASLTFYSNTVKLSNKTSSISYYKYYDQNDKNGVGNQIITLDESQADLIPNVLYIGNIFSFPFIDNDGNINKNGLNVFYDENDNYMIENIITSGNINKENMKFTSYPCFNYDGQLHDSTNIKEYLTTNYIRNNMNHIKYRDYILNYINDSIANKFEIAPEFGVIWKDNLAIGDYERYQTSIEMDLSNFINGRTCIFDEYFGVNLSAIKIKIDEKEITSAPILIKIYILKFNTEAKRFIWVNDKILDFDITKTYETVYNYHNGGSIYVDHVFEDDGRHLTKNVYGIKFKVMQIVPQNNTYGVCKISKIKIYASNILNSNGAAKTVDDVYVNKSDSAYENSYTFNCAEYIWRLPNTAGEWEAVLNDLNKRKADKKLLGFEEQGFETISGKISNIIANEKGSSTNKITLTDNKLNISKGGNNFSVIASYYIAPDVNFGKDVTEVLSDNYLVDSDISISWKYIDYVYISYSCNSFNARELLDLYFGNKIYEAVRAKLNANIENLNASADNYHYSGGIAVTKSYEKQTVTNTKAFEWRSNINVTTINQYKDVYRNDYTTTTSYSLNTWDRYYYNEITSYKHMVHEWGRRGSTYGHEEYDVAIAKREQLVKVEHQGELNKNYSYTRLTNTVRTSHDVISTSSTEQYVGQTLASVKYSSVDNWIAEFGPTEIKYRIN